MMDAATRRDLDAAADEAMREYYAQAPKALESARQHASVLTDGVCRITEVKDTIHSPCVGLILTELGERFPMFDVHVREAARANIGTRVKLNIRISAKGTRWVDAMARLPVDTSTDGWPCLKCWQVLARPNADGTYYICPQCHYQMEVGP